jgi:hypothetical protein
MAKSSYPRRKAGRNTDNKRMLTSPKKMPKGKRAPVSTTTDLKATLRAAVEQVAGQVPTGPGLDGQSTLPGQSIGELVKPVQVPARGKSRAEKAPKAKPAKARKCDDAPLSVVLDPEPGTGWFHVDIDGERVGAVFQSTKKGAKIWVGETRDRALRAEGKSRTAALDAFVAMHRERQP